MQVLFSLHFYLNAYWSISKFISHSCFNSEGLLVIKTCCLIFIKYPIGFHFFVQCQTIHYYTLQGYCSCTKWWSQVVNIASPLLQFPLYKVISHTCWWLQKCEPESSMIRAIRFIFFGKSWNSQCKNIVRVLSTGLLQFKKLTHHYQFKGKYLGANNVNLDTDAYVSRNKLKISVAIDNVT